MPVNALRTITVNLSGDVILDKIFSAAPNIISPGSVTVHELALGANTITVPLATGVSVKGATIIPPSTNVATITLKGVTGDTGVPISPTDPTSIAFGTAPVSFVLTTSAIVSGLRIVWT